MPRHDDRSEKPRAYRFESLESRLALSAQALTAIAPDLQPQPDPMADQVITMGDNSQFQQVAQIREQYGFTGKGQTVAVIDTGIAWDHAALGGGFGAGYKVVGGWDFAENDANPYDDGPFGFHGTHVAGIVGNTDATRYGVASGVDLVALRVFNDNGVSDFKWVEQALQWVHQHRNDFANPITTVNLSVGTRTNLTSLPALATLEDEFAQLEADGIFVSVAAGNAFKTYNTTGLTYPAISPNVVAVASHDADGNVSDFSQRADQVLVAPGRSILSTVPNHVFAGTQINGFMTGTGTSMAAPYVAGASAILREAMTFMGRTNVNQGTLYEQFRATADHIFDVATSHFYSRVNLAAAIEAVVGDDHAGDAANATRLGSLSDRLTLHGTIGKLSDVDQFSFTAAFNGTVTLTIDSTHNLATTLGLNGVTQNIVGRQVTFSVVAGQTYALSLGTSDSIGHYDATLQLNKSIEASNWGTVGQRFAADVSVAGERWFQFSAERSAILTVEGLQANGISRLELYNDQMQLLATTNSGGAALRLDQVVQQGQSFRLRVVGTSDQLDLRVTNLVRLDAGRLEVFGTNQNDNIYLSADVGVEVSVNNANYHFDAASVNQAEIFGLAGRDAIEIHGAKADDWFRLNVGSLRMINSQITVNAENFEDVLLAGGGGHDVAIVTDSAGNDSLSDANGLTRLTGSGFEHRLIEFERTRVISRGGNDQANLTDSSGNDLLTVRDAFATLRSESRAVIVDRFQQVNVFASQGGFDATRIIGTSGDDRILIGPSSTSINNAILATGFELVEAFDSLGRDMAIFEVPGGWTSVTRTGDCHRYATSTVTSTVDGFESVVVADTNATAPSLTSLHVQPAASSHAQFAITEVPVVRSLASALVNPDSFHRLANTSGDVPFKWQAFEGQSVVQCTTPCLSLATPKAFSGERISDHAAVSGLSRHEHSSRHQVFASLDVDALTMAIPLVSNVDESKMLDSFYRHIGQ